MDFNFKWYILNFELHNFSVHNPQFKIAFKLFNSKFKIQKFNIAFRPSSAEAPWPNREGGEEIDPAAPVERSAALRR